MHWFTAGLVFLAVETIVFVRFAYLLSTGGAYRDQSLFDGYLILIFVGANVVAFPFLTMMLILHGTDVFLPVVPDVFWSNSAEVAASVTTLP